MARVNTQLREALKGYAIMALAFGLLLPLAWYIGKGSDRRRARSDMIAIDSLIQRSASAKPASYFGELHKSWDRVCMIVNPGDLASTLTVGTAENGKFLLNLNAQLGDGTEYQDLGIVGRRKSVDYISAIVWACGNQIKNVQKIKVQFIDVDANAVSADYDAELMPDASFVRQWKTSSDFELTNPELAKLVEQHMVVVHDGASGKQWVEH